MYKELKLRGKNSKNRNSKKKLYSFAESGSRVVFTFEEEKDKNL